MMLDRIADKEYNNLINKVKQLGKEGPVVELKDVDSIEDFVKKAKKETKKGKRKKEVFEEEMEEDYDGEYDMRTSYDSFGLEEKIPRKKTNR